MNTEQKFKDYTFDGFGINGRDEYRSRLATLTPSGQSENIGERIVVALNSFEAMRTALKNIAREGWTVAGTGSPAKCQCCFAVKGHAVNCEVGIALALADGKPINLES